MGCASCGTKADGTPSGCGNNGHCSTGSCNKLNTFDWLSMQDIPDPSGVALVEVSYKQGARKEICHCPSYLQTTTGDLVVVDLGNGYNIGRITLSGELVRLQMKRKRINEDRIMNTVARKAGPRDIDRLQEARSKERDTMIRARAIARTLGVELKVGDVEFRGDLRKATFYYTADGRIDFRELVRAYAREFRVKIEMRQIGARQESARIGGLGACGRELCCSTWLTDFKSVTTSAARYQNLSINQTKLSGQCGRLKCCLNYELETYMDALEDFPKDVDKLRTEAGTAVLIKTDIFKRLMYFAYQTERGKSNITAVDVDRVKEIVELNKQGEVPEGLISETAQDENGEVEMDFESITGFIELPEEKKKRRRGKRRKPRGRGRGGNSQDPGKQPGKGQKQPKDQEAGKGSGQPKADGGQSQGQGGPKQTGGNSRRRRGSRNRRNKGNKPGNDKTDSNKS